MGVFNTGPNVSTMDFNPGDIGYVKQNYGHYVQNVGDTDMQFFAVFRTVNFRGDLLVGLAQAFSCGDGGGAPERRPGDGPALARGERAHHA